ncbi:hypothetical protein ATANTOWER_012960 [Ataeniobius toweri]|uniref:Uncharacterized protein n=1 Tax=Ataeniobius toweri TaxID=208326 RepID=A0ABU7AXP5_9TELE|nr:hypothetical protein [Ataeniobius toweri]
MAPGDRCYMVRTVKIPQCLIGCMYCKAKEIFGFIPIVIHIKKDYSFHLCRLHLCQKYSSYIHFLPLYPESGCGGSSLSKYAQTSLSPDTSSSSSWGIWRCSQTN